VTKADVCVCGDLFERDLLAKAGRPQILANGRLLRDGLRQDRLVLRGTAAVCRIDL
jgi:hypothetical protein